VQSKTRRLWAREACKSTSRRKACGNKKRIQGRISNCPVYETEQSGTRRGLLVFLPVAPGPGNITLSGSMPNVVAGEASADKGGEAMG